MVFNMASEQFNSLKEYFIAIARHELNFKAFRALDHISFTVRRGEAFGLVGTNGSGKSTMLKIIAGVLDASEGSCTVTGSIAPLIELGAGFDLDLTARENIYLNGALLGYRKEFIDEHLHDIIEFAELENFMDMPLKNYSSGMVARIAFAIATITEPDILIVDETLAVGDFLFQQKCQRRIQELVGTGNVTVLLVSHSIEMVEGMCDRVCWIEKGKQRMIGPTDEVCAAYRSLGR
ncbi:MAG: ABC transporter ATP-binding protein [Atopobiaceae bacterium]|nr:ABC transporter ATP-binding protein [Atopobiaceae bacterium]